VISQAPKNKSARTRAGILYMPNLYIYVHTTSTQTTNCCVTDVWSNRYHALSKQNQNYTALLRYVYSTALSYFCFQGSVTSNQRDVCTAALRFNESVKLISTRWRIYLCHDVPWRAVAWRGMTWHAPRQVPN